MRAAPTPRVSVVVLSYNRWAELRRGLSHILSDVLPFDLEVIVVDNGSTDGTPGRLADEYPGVRVIGVGENIGVAAYNRGFAAAQGEFVLILDDDSFPAPGAIAGMVDVFDAHPEAGAVALDVRNTDHYRETREPAAVTEKAAISYQMGFNGAGVGIRRSVLLEVGGYAEEFFLYWNEQDLAIRMLRAGYAIVHSPRLVAFHSSSPVNRNSRRGPFFYTRNLYWVLWKHLPFARMVAQTLALLYLALFHTFEQRTTVYLAATWSAWRNGAPAWRLRRPVSGELASRLRIPLHMAFVLFR